MQRSDLNKEETVVNKGLETPLPEFINIALTKKCNYRCFFCCRDVFNSNEELNIDSFYQMRSLIEKIKIIDITSPGETLLYSKIKEAVEFIRNTNKEAGIQITTNGSLLNDAAAEMLSQGLSQITVSLNAARKETYERDMGVKCWDRVLANIRSARKYIPREKLAVSCVVHGDNLDELPDFVRLAADLGAWHVRLVPLSAVRPDQVRQTLWFCMEKYRDTFQAAQEIGRRRGVLVSDLWTTVQDKSAASGKDCLMPFFGSYVRVNGDVWPCCYSGSDEDGCRISMGNIYAEGGFENVWNNARYQALRKKRHLPACKACPSSPGSMEKLSSHVSSDILPESLSQLPLFSAVIVRPDSDKDLENALKSLARQTYPVWEALVVADRNSSHDMAAYSRKYAKPGSRISVLTCDGPVDLHSAVALAGNEARGQFFCLLDSRHAFRPEKLETYLKAFERHGDSVSIIYELPVGEEVIDLRTAMIRTDIARKMNLFDMNLADSREKLRQGLRSRELRLAAIPVNLTECEGFDPSRAAGMLNAFGEKMFHDRNMPEASTALTAAIAADDRNAQFFNNLGVVHWSSGLVREAISFFEKAYELDPDDQPALINLAHTYHETGDSRKAVKVCAGYLYNHRDDEEVWDVLLQIA